MQVLRIVNDKMYQKMVETGTVAVVGLQIRATNHFLTKITFKNDFLSNTFRTDL